MRISQLLELLQKVIKRNDAKIHQNTIKKKRDKIDMPKVSKNHPKMTQEGSKMEPETDPKVYKKAIKSM